MQNRKLLALFCFFISLGFATPLPSLGGEAYLGSDNYHERKRIKTFQQIREAATIRQKWDNSCGSAALATILTRHYGDKTSEAVIITSILRITNPVKIKARGGFSLLDLKRFVQSRGYEGMGYAELSLEELVKLDVPAIVPVKIRGYNHFVVFRGLYGGRVLLSDPSFGTVTMKPDQFREIWKGGIGFVVLRPGAQPAHGLKPKPEEFLVPDATAINRIMVSRPAVLTRPGL